MDLPDVGLVAVRHPRDLHMARDGDELTDPYRKIAFHDLTVVKVEEQSEAGPIDLLDDLRRIAGGSAGSSRACRGR